MAKSGQNLSPKQMQAAALLAAGKGLGETASEVGAGYKTVQNWTDRDDFRAEIARRRDQILSVLLGNLIDASVEAVAVLRKHMRSRDERLSARAADLIVGRMLNVKESVQAAADLEALAARIEAMEGGSDAEA